jgi:hypothetical protein
MAVNSPLSKRLWTNWLIDATLLIAAIIASLSGIYFLFLPVGGFQGGRNPFYGIHVLFERHTWEELHTWGGLAMIGIAAIHLVIHWRWVISIIRRMGKALTEGRSVMSRGAWLNLGLNLVMGISFLLTAVSGVAFLLPTDQAWANIVHRLLSPIGWDLMHTWAGVVLIAASALHLDVHRGWILKTTRRVAQSLGFRLSSTVRHREPIAAR